MQPSLFMPVSDWTPPPELPDLRGREIGVDIETKDDGLIAGRGPSWARRAGHVAGVSVSDGERAWYIPVRHPETACFDPDQVGRWLDDLYRSCTIIMQNGPYDIGWGWAEWGLAPPERLEDTIVQAVIIDENRLTYDLGSICTELGLPGKDEGLLLEAGAAYGLRKQEVKANMWRMPARYVGPYAEVDARQTVQAWRLQRPIIEQEQTTAAYRLEMDLIPLVHRMQRRGLRIDMDLCEQMRVQMRREVRETLADATRRMPIGRQWTIHDCMSPKFLEQAFTRESIPFSRTPKTRRGQFESKWMAGVDHWLPQLVARVRKLNDSAEKFLGEYLMSYSHMGRVYPNIHQFRTDEGGTKSFRFSYSDPPLQQMPRHGDDVYRRIRDVFLAEPGQLWLSRDYKQQEYKLIVHFAALLGLLRAEESVQRYVDDPDTDFHQMVADMTGLERKPAKDTNFAKAFGAGVPKFASMTGKTEDEALEIMEQYDRELPYVKELGRRCDAMAQKRGYIRLIDGARAHFNRWEPWKWEHRPGFGYAKSREVAIEWMRSNFPGQAGRAEYMIKRAMTHKAMNRLIQGSAARQTKLAMRLAAQGGLDPILQYHDELMWSVPEGDEETIRRTGEFMRDAVQLVVPSGTDPKIGLSWGAAVEV